MTTKTKRLLENYISKRVQKLLSEKANDKSIELPNSNLHLLGSGIDTNGNSIIKLSFPNTKGFPIQTNQNLPKTNNLIRGKKIKELQQLSEDELTIIEKEVVKYIKEFGSKLQKSTLKTY